MKDSVIRIINRKIEEMMEKLREAKNDRFRTSFKPFYVDRRKNENDMNHDLVQALVGCYEEMPQPDIYLAVRAMAVSKLILKPLLISLKVLPKQTLPPYSIKNFS